MDAVPPVFGGLQHRLCAPVRHPILWVFADPAARQVCRSPWLLLDAWGMRGGHLGGCDHANWRMEVAPSSQLLPQSHICGRLLLAAGECQVGTKVKLFVVLVMYIYSIIFFFLQIQCCSRSKWPSIGYAPADRGREQVSHAPWKAHRRRRSP